MNTLTGNSLNTLIENIRTSISESKIISTEAAKLAQTKAYWNAGESLVTTLKEIETTGSYGSSIFLKISESINIPKRTLYLMHQFYKEYQELTFTDKTLSWAFYRTLLTIPDREYRKELEAKIVEENLTIRELRDTIKSDKNIEIKTTTELTEHIGKTSCYKIFQDSKSAEKFIDLGFKIYRRLPEGVELETGCMIHVIDEDSFEYEVVDTDKTDLYNYKAKLDKITDGDTFWLNIEVGFYTRITRKVRLRGINTPELLTAEGQKAKKYVYGKLSKAETIIIKSYHRDLYDRYLVDVYYTEKGSKKSFSDYGNFLNMEIVDKKLGSFFDS